MNTKRKGAVFVSPTGNMWKVQTSGTSKAAGVFTNKILAKEKGRQVAMNHRTELIIQKKDGKIEMRNSYGSDPFPPRG